MGLFVRLVSIHTKANAAGWRQTIFSGVFHRIPHCRVSSPYHWVLNDIPVAGLIIRPPLAGLFSAIALSKVHYRFGY